MRQFGVISPLLLLVTGLGVAAPEKGKPAASPRDRAPELISTDGGGPKWKNMTELRAHAEKGDARACFELGERLLLGNGVPADPPAAKGWLERAARQGVADAWFRLGKMHTDGQGVPEDARRGHECYLEAAKLGLPEAMHNVGAALVSGRGMKRDYVEGLAWLIVATKSGAPPDSEQRTREHLARRPAVILAAEQRAGRILEELKSPASVKEKIRPADAKPATNRDPGVAPSKVNLDLAAEVITPKPGVSLPKPDGK